MIFRRLINNSEKGDTGEDFKNEKYSAILWENV